MDFIGDEQLWPREEGGLTDDDSFANGSSGIVSQLLMPVWAYQLAAVYLIFISIMGLITNIIVVVVILNDPQVFDLIYFIGYSAFSLPVFIISPSAFGITRRSCRIIIQGYILACFSRDSCWDCHLAAAVAAVETTPTFFKYSAKNRHSFVSWFWFGCLHMLDVSFANWLFKSHVLKC